MKNVQELFKEGELWSEYSKMIQSFELDVLAWEDEIDYQGDSILLLHNTNTGEYGYLVFGWGSCSGCDALQACKTYEDLEVLQSKMVNSIVWFDNAAEALRGIQEKDWEGSFINSVLYNSFIDKSVYELNSIISYEKKLRDDRVYDEHIGYPRNINVVDINSDKEK